MYSRYIPPPRGDSKPSSIEPAISSQSPQVAPKAQPTAYARYVPPPKSTRPDSLHSSPAQHFRFDEDAGANGEQPPAKKVKLIQDDATSLQTSNQLTTGKTKKAKKKALQAGNQDGPIDSTLTVGKGASRELKVQPNNQKDATICLGDIEVQQTPTDSRLKTKEPSLLTEGIPVVEVVKQQEKKKKKNSRGGKDSSAQVKDEIPLRHKAILDKKARYTQTTPKPVSKDATVDNSPPNADQDPSQQEIPKIELHGLEPIPQPKPVILDTSTPLYETLPPWLASPIRIPQDASASFTDFGVAPDLGITSAIAERLASKGYGEAFAIQTGVIPLLLPDYRRETQGDVLVSAATGSGKTLAYALPIIRDISQSSRHTTRLRALIVAPTRELVRQVQQVCEDCAGVFALDGAKRRSRIAIAMGSQSFEHEQALLVERDEVYDPGAYQQKMKRLARWNRLGDDSDDGEDSGYNTEDEERDAIRRREDELRTLPDHVMAYKSKTDVLICTPGRLVEHIKFTPGFTLEFVRWLVVDEADKLLGQNFQQWLDVVIPRLHTRDRGGARNHKQSNLSGVRKIILSATMTRDLDQLEGLKLRRPSLVVLEGSKAQDETLDGVKQTEHVLPKLLEEAALKISDANLKPLFLIDLLRSHYILRGNSGADGHVSDNDETSSSGSDSDSDSNLEPMGSRKPAGPSNAQSMSTVLIFTKSNETALRLSRLLGLLAPKLAPLLGTLTSTTPYTTRRETMRSFNAGKLRIIVASDLVARGIDLPLLDHVVNYDMPSSIASYVHRVGRTARAGNTGKAWTLFTNPEARWFWNEVASEKVIQRSKAVERVRVTEEKEDEFDEKVAAYEAALEKLGQEAGQAHHKGKEGQ